MKNIREVCEILGLTRNRFITVRNKSGVKGKRTKSKVSNFSEVLFSDEDIKVIKSFIDQVKKIKTVAKEIKKEIKIKEKHLEFFKVKGSNIYRVYEVIDEIPSFLGTCTEEELEKFKDKLGAK